MAKEKETVAEQSPEESDALRLKEALKERLANLKEQLAKAEALPDAHSNKGSLVKNFTLHIDELNKELRK